MRARPTVLGYAAAGPLGMAAVVLPSHAERWPATAVVALLAAGFVAILRPASYACSKWRAVGAAFWLFVPTALSSLVVIPADAVRLGISAPAGWSRTEPDFAWAMLWSSAGFAGCCVAAVRVAWGEARSARATLERRPFWTLASWTRSVSFPEKELLLVGGSVASMALLTTSLWIVGSSWTANQREFLRDHVPPPDRFEALLNRDLAARFGLDEAAAPAHELLGGPFEGEYYVWVRLGASSSPDSSGLVRAHPEARSRFVIREFVPAGRIRGQSESFLNGYPASVAAAALRKAKALADDSHRRPGP